MTAVPIPALSPDSWVTDASLKLDYALTHFLVAEYSQTHIYPGNVASLTYYIQRYGGDNLGLQDALTKRLPQYFASYFGNPYVEVLVSDDPTTDNKTILQIFVEVDDDKGSRINASYAAQVADSRLLKFEKANNYGT
jgi:hypothetical protein